MNDLKTLKQLLEAAIRCTNWDLKVYDYNDEDLYETPSEAPNGLMVAPGEDDSFKVVILPEVRQEPVKTIAGERLADITYFNIYAPKYEAGDPSVGEQAYYYVDTDKEYTWSFRSVSDVAIKVVSWIVEYELATVVSNEAEYLYHSEQERYFNEEV